MATGQAPGQVPTHNQDSLQHAWAISDNKAAFTKALEERGYRLARGDRRGFVAIDTQGEAYALPKWIGIKTSATSGALWSTANAKNGRPSKTGSKPDTGKNLASASRVSDQG